jgi:PAS domain S-box-containing protein
MPDSASSRILVVAGPEESDVVARELANDGEVVRVADRAALEGALTPAPAVVVFATGIAGLSFVDLLSILRGRGVTTPAVVFARTFRDDEMRSVMAAGATDYVSNEQVARLAFAVRRELARAPSATRMSMPPGATADTAAELLEAVVDALPFVAFVKEADELRLVVANKALADMFGYTKDYLIGKLDHDYFPKEQADGFVAIDRAVLEGGEMKFFEEVARAGDGVDYHFATRKLPIVAGGKKYLLGVTENVTERKRAEEAFKQSRQELEEANRRLEANVLELKKSRDVSARVLASYQQRALQMEIIRQQNEDLDRLAQDLAKSKRLEEQKSREIEQAARLKSEFLANFSHEIRTPLNGIIGYCDLLAREEGGRLTPHGRRDLQVVKSNAKTLLALINDILDLSKIEAGHVETVRETVDVAALVDECIATVREFLKGKTVDVYANVAPEVSTVETDALKLRQILLNLLTNAAKFTDTGEIVVEVKAATSGIIVTVEDTGSGIAAEHLPFIFEKFRQLDGSSTRKVGGTGLGLAIVRELCRILGGAIDVKSTVGRGSVFTVNLPTGVSPSAVTVISAPITSRDKPTGASVLVVDDDPLVHQLLKTELEREGMRVLLASDGVSAMTIARQHRPSAIVLDIQLPKLDGWTVLAELKNDPLLASIPIIIISIEEQRAKGFALGACEYLVKPIDADRLVSIVSRSVAPGTGDVLVVDDDSTTRELVTRQLRRAGFSASEAASGDDALTQARANKPAMMVLDLMMPGTNGFDVIRKIRSENMGIPVLVLTGKDLTPEETELLREGITSVVQKNGAAIEAVVEEAKRVLLEARRIAKDKLPRVLYVEDSAQNRDVVRRYLNGVYDVIEAEDGEHGLDRAQRDAPDLILMDLSLPRLDGWEATRRLKAGPLASIPVVALTAHASREDQARARAAGCDGYLTKPVERDHLIATIKQHLKARAERAAAATT